MAHNASSALRARIRRAQRNHPGWHIWASGDGSHIYATGVNERNRRERAQVTLDAPTTARIGKVIADWENDTEKVLDRAARQAA